MTNQELNLKKDIDLKYSTIGDTLTYSVGILNNSDFDVKNVIVTDLVPQGADFIDESVEINGVRNKDINPAFGIEIGTIPVSVVYTISYKAKVVVLPSSSVLDGGVQLDFELVDNGTLPSGGAQSVDSNSVVTTINSPAIQFIKFSETNIITASKAVGMELTYNMVLRNLGNVDAKDMIILNTVPEGTTFIEDSLMVLGNNLVGENIKAPTGFRLGTLEANSYTTLSYKVLVNSIPSNSIISNVSEVAYNYIVDPITLRHVDSRESSNVFEIPVTEEGIVNFEGISKSVDKSVGVSGDTLNYTIIVPNLGNVEATDVILVDTVPYGTSYIQDSLKINGVNSRDPVNRIVIGTIAAGTIAIVKFSVKIN